MRFLFSSFWRSNLLFWPSSATAAVFFALFWTAYYQASWWACLPWAFSAPPNFPFINKLTKLRDILNPIHCHNIVQSTVYMPAEICPSASKPKSVLATAIFGEEPLRITITTILSPFLLVVSITFGPQVCSESIASDYHGCLILSSKYLFFTKCCRGTVASQSAHKALSVKE